MTIRHKHLYPHVEAVPNFAAYGDFSLCTKHPDDLHFHPIFDQVSIEFVRGYVTSRMWCCDAYESGWDFICLPSSAIQSKGAIQ